MQGYPDDGGATDAPDASTAAEGIAPASEPVSHFGPAYAQRNGSGHAAPYDQAPARIEAVHAAGRPRQDERAQAEGDAQRFRSVLAEYQKAPQVTRDRMYLESMQQIYSNVTKVLVDAKQGGSLMYLPLDKLLQMVGNEAPAQVMPAPGQPAAPPSASPASSIECE